MSRRPHAILPQSGAILLEFITNGLLALKVSPYDQQVVQGAALGVAILLDRARATSAGAAAGTSVESAGPSAASASVRSDDRTVIDISNTSM
ncbi:hypothetical protein [Streptomyces sp. NPDC050287]|uniref:hypothetical protein n=1 Tax=Streptomyces sp. NPDC050287 TaxID=3365608 RepID=UPI0037978292